jgi:hypothetical protein
MSNGYTPSGPYRSGDPTCIPDVPRRGTVKSNPRYPQMSKNHQNPEFLFLKKIFEFFGSFFKTHLEPQEGPGPLILLYHPRRELGTSHRLVVHPQNGSEKPKVPKMTPLSPLPLVLTREKISKCSILHFGKIQKPHFGMSIWMVFGHLSIIQCIKV